jgi:hypothetical protein
MRPNQKVETYPDGIVDIYAGAEGRKVGQKKGSFRFEAQTLGVNRYYQSRLSVAGNKVDRLIKVPANRIINRMDIAVIRGSGEQYRIIKIETKHERGVDLLELESVQVTIRNEE